MYRIGAKVKGLMLILLLLTVSLYNTSEVYAVDNIDVNAETALMIERNTGKVIYEKNSNEQNYPASVTKILTAIITIENCNLEDTATVSQSAISNIPTGYVIAPLYVGEQMKIKDLLYALMLKSANDAAYVLAEHVGESVEGFSEIMNNKAKELGCTNTHFVNPNGIHNVEHYTTAQDLYLISNYAMKNETFAKIVSTYTYTLPATNKYSYANRIMENTNNFINPKSTYYNESVKGIKTGTTDQAGNCLITYSAKNGLEFITVVLGAKTANSRFTETSKMIEYGFDNYTLTNVYKKGEVVTNIEVAKATKDTKSLNLLISDDFSVVNNVNTKVAELSPEIILDEELVAPLSKGQKVGIVKYTVDGIEYAGDLLAESDVELKTYYVEIAIGAVVFVVILGLVTVIKRKKKNRKR